MSISLDSESRNGQPHQDRRANSRYALQLEFDLFHLHGARHLVWAGTGRTVNWSRNTILIRPARPLSSTGAVQLVVRWTAGVQLIIVGTLLSNQERGAVVKILRRRFRGKPSFDVLSGHLAGAGRARDAHARAC